MKVYFNISLLRPNPRQFRQQNLELSPSEQLRVEVELEDELEVESDVQTINLAGLERLAEIFDNAFVETVEPSGYNDEEDFEFEEDNDWESPDEEEFEFD